MQLAKIYQLFLYVLLTFSFFCFVWCVGVQIFLNGEIYGEEYIIYGGNCMGKLGVVVKQKTALGISSGMLYEKQKKEDDYNCG